MAQYSPPPPAPGAGTFRSGVVANGRTLKPTFETTKGIKYVASGATSNKILSFSQTANTESSDGEATAVNEPTPSSLVVTNTGIIPAIVVFVYEEYSDTNTDVGQASLQTVLLPNESVTPLIRGAIVEAANNPLRALSGTAVDFTTTTIGDGTSTLATLKSDSGDNVASGELANTTDLVVFELDNGHEKYRVGDYLRCENEILRVEGTYDDNPTAETVIDNHIVVSRGHLGSTTASHSGTADIYFHCFNEHYDYDRVLQGNTQLNSSDSQGRYKSSNFFGYGRTDATTDNKTFGIVAGSVAFRFYSQAYMDIPFGGTGVAGGTGGSNISISSSTSSMLTASTAYAFNLTIDDSSAVPVSFTTSSSNVNFGGSDGIVSLLNSAILTATRTAGNNLFGYSCTVSIVDGKLRFTSDSHLSPHDGTNGSKILLEDDGSGGTNLFAGTSGIFPDILNTIAPVKPIISPVSVYNALTYSKSPNMGRMCYDDGTGGLIYNGSRVGEISYETGAFNFSIPSLPNAEFEIQVTHDSPFSGKLDNAKEDSNSLVAVYANVFNRNIDGKVNIQITNA